MSPLSDPRRLVLHRLELDAEQLLELLLARRAMVINGRTASVGQTLWNEDASVWSDDVTAPKRAAA